MENKVNVALLIPYKVRNGSIFVYLQKRTKDAKRLADMFGFFGGKVNEGEGVKEGLRREIKEELDFTLDHYEKLGTYESSMTLRNVFVLEIEEDFENKIRVLEGEYGKFFNEAEVASEPKILYDYKYILGDLYKFVRRKNNLLT